jgi:hypothetical protein
MIRPQFIALVFSGWRWLWLTLFDSDRAHTHTFYAKIAWLLHVQHQIVGA